MNKKPKLISLILLVILIFSLFLTMALHKMFTYLYESKYTNINNLNQLNNDYENNQTKWLIYECNEPECGGWADRLKGIMSIYALSLMTRRQFLIDMQSPCNFSQLFLPNEIDWSISPPKIVANNEESVLVECMSQTKLGPECLRKYEEVEEEVKKEMAPKVIRLKSNKDWFSFFSLKKNFHTQIMRLNDFDSVDQFQFALVFNKWYRKLFKLSSSLNEKYEFIKRQARMMNDTRVYCAQIRIGGARPDVEFDAEFNEMGVQRKFWKFIHKEFINKVMIKSE